ncbi:hypothetical protein A6284_20820 [Bacillus wiedmannii]|nr:hypothetical protein A6284_20820 [Bacillus wiedmannii]
MNQKLQSVFEEQDRNQFAIQTQEHVERDFYEWKNGNLSKEYNVFFNHNQIIHLLFKGFETEDELELRSKLSEF